ncbi:D-alanyl-D-alanine dipeptidase [Phormidesmis sp. 146-33]
MQRCGTRVLNWLIFVLVGWAIVTQSQPSISATKAEFVNLQAISPNIVLDIRYATTNNFTKQKLYRQAKCFLRISVAEKLSRVQTELETQGLGLKVYDCYRPLSVQKRMWQLKPDPNYVANPVYGSRHNRGSAVDVTLVDRTGKNLAMPTEFDEFSDRAHRDYNSLSNTVKTNRATLERIMEKHGFVGLQTEWWHFDATEWRQFPVADVSFEAI